MKKKVTAMVLAASMLFGAVGSVGSVASADASQVSVENYSYSQNAVKALNYLNDIRGKMGISPLELNPFLTKSAENHANYIAVTGLKEHIEVPGKQGFTGETPADRIRAVGTPEDIAKGSSEVIAFNYTDPTKSIDEMLDTALHRVSMVDPTIKYIGVSLVGKTLVINFGGPTTQTGISVYPYEGQANVPTIFTGYEKPNPLEAFGVSQTGFVISFKTSDFVSYRDKTTNITVKDSNGKSLPYFISSAGNGTFLIYPKAVLSPGSKYTVSVDYSPLTGDNAGKVLNKTWSFTTAGVGSTNPTPNLPTNPTTPPTTGQPTKYTKDNIGIKLNGSFISVVPKPVIKSGTTFIPLRGVFEKMGATVTWNQQKKQVTVVKDSKKVILTIGSTGAYVNGAYVKLSSAPYVTPQGYTYVPLRFISETIGARVGWDQSNYIVSIIE
jgi:uncharacterized protein YkwD